MSSSLHHSRVARTVQRLQRWLSAGEEMGVTRQLIEDTRLEGDKITIRGRRVVNFGVCSYLGLGDDRRLKAAAIDAADRYGTSYSSSTAYTAVPLYGDLVERLEEIFGSSVVLAGTTTLAHFAALPILVRPRDVVFVDGQAHASILAATPTLQMHGSAVRTIRHNDMGQLEAAILEAGSSTRVWYLTDGVFSMHGDTAPAAELDGLLRRHENLYVYCDDAHGFSWDGLHGRGQHLARSGWHERLVISVGLSKSFGSLGGAIATKDEDAADLIRVTGGPVVFGGPIPPPMLGAGVASADIHLSTEIEDLQQNLHKRIDLVNRLCADIGLPVAAREHTPLWFLDVGTARAALRLADTMRQSGFYLNGATFPVVPRGHAGVRFTVTNYNSMRQIEDMLTCLNDHLLALKGETKIVIDVDALQAEDGTRATDA